jgi:hypothetical protein
MLKEKKADIKRKKADIKRNKTRYLNIFTALSFIIRIKIRNKNRFLIYNLVISPGADNQIIFIERAKLFQNYFKISREEILQRSIFAGVKYKSTALDWASFLRELSKEHFNRNITHKKLRGEKEIDESLFGRRVKYHRGNPHKGLKIMFISIT